MNQLGFYYKQPLKKLLTDKTHKEHSANPFIKYYVTIKENRYI